MSYGVFPTLFSYMVCIRFRMELGKGCASRPSPATLECLAEGHALTKAKPGREPSPDDNQPGADTTPHTLKASTNKQCVTKDPIVKRKV